MERRVRILIADDRRSVRLALRALLTLCPEVELVGEAADGLEAVQMATALSPDVVLMDMQMPVMDGIQATQCIKAKLPEIKIVALSLYDKYEPAAIAAGVDDFLIKGDTAEDFLDALLKATTQTEIGLVKGFETTGS